MNSILPALTKHRPSQQLVVGQEIVSRRRGGKYWYDARITGMRTFRIGKVVFATYYRLNDNTRYSHRKLMKLQKQYHYDEGFHVDGETVIRHPFGFLFEDKGNY